MRMNTDTQLLEALTREGVLLHVSVRYWRATKQLKPEDLGLDPDRVSERLIHLGHKKLLPKEALSPFALIESRAHALVEASTFPFLKGLARYLPNARLEDITRRLENLRREFDATRNNFLSGYADTREAALAEWRLTAIQLTSDPDRLVSAVAAAFPDVSRMDRHFGFEVQLFQVRAPEALDLELVEAADVAAIRQARDTAAREAAVRIQSQAREFVSDCVASLRQRTAELCTEMLESIRTGKTGVHQRTLNRLIRFIDEFKQLNFAGDQQMAAELQRVRQEFLQRTAQEYRNNGFARQRLETGLQGLADTARELASQGATEIVAQFGNLGQRRLCLLPRQREAA